MQTQRSKGRHRATELLEPMSCRTQSPRSCHHGSSRHPTSRCQTRPICHAAAHLPSPSGKRLSKQSICIGGNKPYSNTTCGGNKGEVAQVIGRNSECSSRDAAVAAAIKPPSQWASFFRAWACIMFPTQCLGDALHLQLLLLPGMLLILRLLICRVGSDVN